MENILGGVSPLKARQASRGGRHAGAATATSGRRGGFAKSSGARGAGGRNVGGYNVQTRWAGDGGLYGPVRSGGTYHYAPPPQKPISDGKVDKDAKPHSSAHADANVTVNVDGRTGHYEHKDIYKDIETKTEKEKSSYREAYDAMEDKDGGKYNKRNKKTYTNFEEFEKDAKQWNKDNPGYKEYDTKREKVYSHTEKKWVWDDEGNGGVGNTSSASATATASASTDGNKSTDEDKEESPAKYGWYRFGKKFKK